MIWKSFKISRLFGIPIYLHWSFLIIPVFILSMRGLSYESLITISLFVAVFICVLLHELGHALSARYYGVETMDIILSLIGGVARLKRLPEKPLQEFVIAIAGPLVNVVIAALILLGLYFTDSLAYFSLSFDESSSFFLDLVKINIALFVFNLIPAFPMDGGRIFRSLLSMRLNRVQATRWAACLGQFIAVGFAAYGVFTTGSFVLIFIAVFIYWGASGEYQMVLREHFANTYTVKDAMLREFPVLQYTDTVEDAYELFRTTGQAGFIVMNIGKVAGILTQQTLREAVAANQQTQLVSEIMTTTLAVVQPATGIFQTYQLMQTEQYRLLPVMENEILVGIVDWRHLVGFLKQHKMLRK